MKKKTIEQQQLAGILRRNRLPKATSEFLIRRTSTPRGMEEGAKPYFRKWVILLVEAGVLTKLDLIALADMARCAFRLAQAEALVAEMGPTVKGRGGKTVRNPVISTCNMYRRELQRYGVKFGLTPYDRTLLPARSEIPRLTLAEHLEAMVREAVVRSAVKQPEPPPDIPPTEGGTP